MKRKISCILVLALLFCLTLALPSSAYTRISYGADCLAVQIKARHVVEAEIEIAATDIGLVDAADGGQQKRHGMLGDSVRGVRRHANNVDLSEGVLHIHVVEARATQSDELYAQRT